MIDRTGDCRNTQRQGERGEVGEIQRNGVNRERGSERKRENEHRVRGVTAGSWAEKDRCVKVGEVERQSSSLFLNVLQVFTLTPMCSSGP